MEKHHFPYWVQMLNIKINKFTLKSVGEELPKQLQGGTVDLTLTPKVLSVNLPIPMPVAEQTKLTEVYVIVEYTLGS